MYFYLDCNVIWNKILGRNRGIKEFKTLKTWIPYISKLHSFADMRLYIVQVHSSSTDCCSSLVGVSSQSETAFAAGLQPAETKLQVLLPATSSTDLHEHADFWRRDEPTRREEAEAFFWRVRATHWPTRSRPMSSSSHYRYRDESQCDSENWNDVNARSDKRFANNSTVFSYCTHVQYIHYWIFIRVEY